MLVIKNLVFVLVVPGTVAVYVPLLIARSHTLAPAPILAAGVVLLAVGASIMLWCVWDFAAFGRGTPAPIDAPKQLVVRGLYGYVRNPMYVGACTMILGWAVLFRAPVLVAYALVLWVFFNAFVTLYEEPHLAKTFGREYEEYRARVGRWFPRVRGVRT